MVKSNLLANFAGQGWAACMGLAFIPVYLHYLGAEGYGLIGFFALLQAWLTLLDLSIGQTLSREVARFQSGVRTSKQIWTLIRSCEAVAIVAAMLTAAVVASTATWLARYWIHAQTLSSDQVANAIMLMGVVVGLRMLEGLYRGALIGAQQQVLLNALGAGVATLRWGGAAAVLGWVRSDVTAFFAWQAFASVTAVTLYGCALYNVLPRPQERVAATLRALVEVWRFSTAMLATGILAIVLTQTDKMLLSRHLSLEAFGYYSVAVLISNAMYLLVGPVTQAYSPRLAGLVAQNDETGLCHTYHHAAQTMSIVLVPAGLLLSAFAEPVLRLWTRDPVLAQHAAPVLTLLALGTMLNGLMGMPHMLQLAHGWAGLAARINLVAVAVAVPLLIAITPRYGAMGTALFWLVLNGFTMVAGIHLMHRRLIPRQQWRWYWADTAKPALAAGGVITCSALLLSSNLDPLAETLWLVSTGALAIAAASATSRGVRERVKAFVAA